jgi:hypothetical protein
MKSIKMSTERLRENVGLLSEQEVVQYMQELEEIIMDIEKRGLVNKQVAFKTAKAQMDILSLHSCNRYNLTLVQLEEKHKEPAKIELKSGYGSNFLPVGNYKNYTMLVAIANYSENPICNDRARFMINEDNSLQDKARVLKGEGSFMIALMSDTFAEAFKKADGSNRKALIQGLTNNEIEL